MGAPDQITTSTKDHQEDQGPPGGPRAPDQTTRRARSIKDRGSHDPETRAAHAEGAGTRRSPPLPKATAYQLDLVMPGSSPRCAMSRKRTREMPNFVSMPRGRPSMASRERTRT